MIQNTKKEECCGCAACYSVCPVSAITMVADKQGFLYPVVKKDKCIKCKKCELICPIINHVGETIKKQNAYLVQHKNERILKESTSGGAFSAIAEVVIEKGGVIFGAAYDSDFSVFHKCVTDKKSLGDFRNSKYVQSEIRDSYKKVKEYIAKNIYVLYSGTPCQIEGLLNYIGEKSKYLITVDIVCHATPSPAVWKTYVSWLKKENKLINNIRFRDKEKYGYLYSQFRVDTAYKSIFEGIETNIMLRAFFSEICNRPSCYQCSFKKRYRRSDITIWDCFDVKKFCPHTNIEQKKGVSRVLCHSQNGKNIVKLALESCLFDEIDVDKALMYDANEMFMSVQKNPQYDDFWKMYYEDGNKALNHFFPVRFRDRMEHFIRIFSIQVGFYDIMRKLYKLLFGNRKR